jgi:hypothetical protein
MGIERFTGQKAVGSEVTYQKQREVAAMRYLKIEKTAAKVLNYWRSTNGITWILFYTEASTAYVETSGNKINWVGIMIGCQNTGQNVSASFWWFRYNWTADFDPTLHH